VTHATAYRARNRVFIGACVRACGARACVTFSNAFSHCARSRRSAAPDRRRPAAPHCTGQRRRQYHPIPDTAPHATRRKLRGTVQRRGSMWVFIYSTAPCVCSTAVCRPRHWRARPPGLAPDLQPVAGGRGPGGGPGWRREPRDWLAAPPPPPPQSGGGGGRACDRTGGRAPVARATASQRPARPPNAAASTHISRSPPPHCGALEFSAA